MTTYYVLRIGSWLSRFVPLAVMYALGALAARLASALPIPARAVVRTNLARVMGCPANHPVVRRAAAHVFHCQALNYIDLMRLDRVTPREFEATVVRGDLTPFFQCLATGKGAIIVSAHLGNMDYVVQWLGMQGIHIHTVMERLEPERLFELVRRQRATGGMHIHALDSNVVGTLTEVLRSNGVVALLADRDVGGSTELVDFFGAPAPLPVGPALLSLRTGAPLLPAFGRRLHDDRLYVTVHQPVQLARTGRLRDDLHTGTQRLARILEEGIAAAPDQWLVFEPIWKDGAA